MILAVDVGNTHIVMGCIEGEKIEHIFRLGTDPKKTEQEYAANIYSILTMEGVNPRSLEGAILSSVVEPVTELLRTALKRVLGKMPLVVGRGIKTGLNIGVEDPASVGADLVVGAVAALNTMQPPLIIIDMGTATTLFVLDATGKFLGGAIVPGLAISVEALSSGTSQLPRIALNAPKKCISANTVTCMQSGAVYGTAAMMDGMIERMEEELGCRTTVIATGGLAAKVVPHCRREIIYDENLLLRGLGILWEKNRRDK